ncbi:molybdopterin oxidoreductase, iron-sulfur binding subunit [Chthoniobacter flavus Ellin428]|uniref:Molybdopterin oxidoreductase, iron-sulfur binding subunit n=1 Tax=Chthoniobacter flavus Ellin428 TaxID=497964 RepID=B4CZY0_9BACT|nr:TAT-variant-translocated molybdopterin oxidoreductase [Chthoniobacter flavus]EDY20294.1 molybdopterin oxidoreductase, iron-sulfur binding subunit [Chthoniobacter flavus Ellin428]TCO94191.1 molybdopterin-containing oxidoreductase family iron-sulfur binding subunit [Chthoniobacter flavus]
MKRIFEHPSEPLTGKKYWRSLGQLSDTPEFRGWLEREFPQGASEMQGGDLSRRNFLKLMGASTALAGLGLTACRRPIMHLVPFTKGVEWSIPGKPLFFTTARPTRRGYAPLVATTHDGRPTKIEGNPLHPISKARTDIHSQSSILDLYDPDRAKKILKDGAVTDEAAFVKELDGLLKGAGDGSGLAFLLQEDNSPTRQRLIGLINQKFPKVTWATYEPLGPVKDETIFGQGAEVVADFSKADVILSLDSDFLGSDGDLTDIRGFTTRRRVTGPDSKMNRLYVVENRYTITGGMSDHRLRLPASQVGAFALAIAAAVASATSDSVLAEVVKAIPAPTVKIDPEWIKYCAEDLIAAKGKSIVVAGSRQSAAVQALATAINAALGNIGKTIIGRKSTVAPTVSIAELSKHIADKKVQTLFIIGPNPVYNAPGDLDWATLQKSVPTVIRLGQEIDETAKLSKWNVPLAHYLEFWGDGRAVDGSYVSVQPMILPLFGAWSELDLLAKVAGLEKPHGPELVQDTFKEIAKPADFTTAWAKFLHDGFLAGSEIKPATLNFNGGAASKLITEKFSIPALSEDTFEVVLTPCPKVDDGRYNNNGWLQEIPDPITKVTWDNAALISPATARKLGIEEDEDSRIGRAMVQVILDKRVLELPALVAPGHADNSITIALGYGRTEVGRVGATTGFNAYPLRTTGEPYIVLGAKLRVTGHTYNLAITQEHHALEGRGGDLTREATVSEYKENPEFAKTMGMDAHIPPNKSLYTHPELNNPELSKHPAKEFGKPLVSGHGDNLGWDPHGWGMVVDLNSCIGCSACMVACQAENNIPIVGKEQVINGREMHWIRTDRYFASVDKEDPDPEMVSQPIMCQHCENAPCETVCPVNATVHNEEGLNVMAYNRCIGTRYCANNCPFKVRRFNFFDYNLRDAMGSKNGGWFTGLHKWNLISEKKMEDTLKMQKNPNVTVRMRGVMEKCTFCVQRIQEAKIATKVAIRDSDNYRIPADSFTTACAQVCPADAITFGDIFNPESSVAKLKQSERGYRLLEYLNISTRTSYLARIRNPNPKMPGAEKIGAAMKSHHGGEKHEAAAEPKETKA